MDAEFTAKILVCVDCGEEFVFTISAQEYFAQKGFTEDPRRCKSCYLKLKRERRNGEGHVTRREPRRNRVAQVASRAHNNFNGNAYRKYPEDLG
ncbi:MAG: zinc-ribbon domain-containing protein [candidate division Zixibacteria bacterium]|nr:zinc-ribbon domain-containing protein [candidate division Zixibacteria bacterium]